MSRTLEVALSTDLRKTVRAYIRSFAHSYARLASGPADFQADLATYDTLVRTNSENIYRAAAFGISGYSNLYGILPREAFDEFKIIYFLGKAIRAQLILKNHVKIAQAHMFTLVGLLDEALRNKSVVKPGLTAAMTKLIRFDKFDDELGKTGCYLIYKCSSTAPDHVEKGSS